MSEVVNVQQVAVFVNPQNLQTADATVVLGNDNAIGARHNAHDADPGVHFQSSTLALRPAFGTTGRKWYTSDTGKLWFDSGAAWVECTYAPLAAPAFTGAVTMASTLVVTGVLTATGGVVGNASTATALQTGRTITLTGNITGVSAAFDGSGNLSFATTIAAGVVTNAMIAVAAGIPYSKLTLTGAVLNADLAGSIADSNLLTIATAGKVANSATSGVSAATASTLALRDVNADAAFRYLTINGVVYTWPATSGSVGQVLSTNGAGALSWAAAAAGFVTGSGTIGKISKFTGAAALGDSLLSESGGLITVAGALTVSGVITTTGAVLPSASALYDLGATAQKFVNLWLSGVVNIAGNQVLSGRGTGFSPTWNAVYASNKNASLGPLTAPASLAVAASAADLTALGTMVHALYDAMAITHGLIGT